MTKTASKVRNGSFRVEGPSLPMEGFVRLPVVLRHIPECRSSFLRKVREKIYPAPVRLGPRTVAWRVQDIRQLIADLEAGRKKW